MGVNGRFLRPSFLAAGGGSDEVWVVDELQPVAALLDAGTGTVRRLVSWPDLPPPPEGDAWEIRAAGPDLWVQPEAGAPVARIDPDGGVHGGYSSGRRLRAAEARGAWLIDSEHPQHLVFGPDEEPGPLTDDPIILVAPDGTTRRVHVDRPVRNVYVIGDATYLEVDDAPHTLFPLGGDTWEVRWRQAWMRVPSGEIPALLTVAEHEVEAPALPPRRTGVAHSWQAEDSTGIRAGQRSWTVDSTGEKLLVGGVDLGSGQVTGMLGTDAALWVAVRREDGSVPLLRVDPESQAVTTVLAGDSVDIAGHCWPSPRPPVDADSFAGYQLQRFGDLNTAWQDTETGTFSPLAGRTSRWAAELSGAWPETRVVLSFDHAGYPGLRLRRRLRLFDELGRPHSNEYADIHLMEDIDTNSLPPAAEAVDGMLEV